MATNSEETSNQYANIKVMSPSPNVATPLNFALPLESTIRELKDQITASLDSRPSYAVQRLIYRGRILQDEHNIRSIVGASANGESVSSHFQIGSYAARSMQRTNIHAQAESPDSYTFHLALKPSGTTPLSSPPRINSPIAALTSSSASASTTTTGSQRPGVTTSTSTSYMRNRPPGRPTQEALADLRERVANFQNQILRLGGTPEPGVAPIRFQARVRYGAAPGELQELARVPTPGLGSTTTTTTTTTRATLRLSRSPRQTQLPEPGHTGVPVLAANGQQLSSIIRGLQSGPNPPPLFLLRGPDGEYALLAGNQGAAHARHTFNSVADARAYLPGELPVALPATESPHFDGLNLDGLARALNRAEFGMGVAHPPPLIQGGRQMPAVLEEMLERARPQAPRPQGEQNRAAFQPARPQPENRPIAQWRMPLVGDIMRRVEEGIAHFWLAVRLAIFVVLFSGGGGLRRKIMMGVLAFVIFGEWYWWSMPAHTTGNADS